MVWIKRNLYFLIGSLVAVALMIVGGVILFGQISQEAQVAEDIGKQYSELLRLTQLNPHPGDEKIDNIKVAKEQEASVRAFIAKMKPFFHRITPIPDPAVSRISNAEFAAQLRITISQLSKTAERQSVILPKDYYFTFESQKKIMNFDPASLDSLAVHLGEIKALSEVLFDAKINSLDGIRRESISANDNNPSDYLPLRTVSTPLADHTPYEVTFRCFSAELALVMASFANSPDGFVVKTINVEPAGPAGEEATANMQPGGGMTASAPPPGLPPGGIRPETLRRGPMTVTPTAPAAPAPITSAAVRGGQVFLTEKPFRVTLMLDVVKIRSGAK